MCVRYLLRLPNLLTLLDILSCFSSERFWRRRLAKRRCNAIRAANEADPPAAEEVVADADAELPIAKEADPPAADADAGGDGEADPPAADADAGGDGEVATATEVEA